MRRREFLSLLSGAAATLPFASSHAQQPTIPVIGFLNAASRDGYKPELSGFHQGLQEFNYIEGRNVVFEYRWAEGNYDRLPAMAADLVRREVTVISANTPANLVAKAATSTIPIVFTAGTDPVRLGLVASLSKPGGNITGVTQLTGEVAPKRIELAHELVPTATEIALLINPTNPSAEALTLDSRTAAVTLGLQLNVLHASTEVELIAAFATFKRTQAAVLVIAPDSFFNSQVEQLVGLAIRNSVPAIYEYREFISAGGLASYSGSNTDSYRRAGAYVGRILKGERPADLPVQQSTKLELIINSKTANALGITIPQSVLSRADEVIE
jgi:putative tryptophan/tyrosine transport system substrate-binding protein